MDDLEQKLNSVLSNPQLMQQIMSMARSMGATPSAPVEQSIPSPAQNPLPSIDPKMLQVLSGFAQQGGAQAVFDLIEKGVGESAQFGQRAPADIQRDVLPFFALGAVSGKGRVGPSESVDGLFVVAYVDDTPTFRI